jgi:nicotinamidase-related amidase
MNTALVLIDIQKDYFPGGKMELEGPLEASAQAFRLLGFFRQQKWPTVHIQHISTRPGATFFIPATEGVEIHESVVPLPGETVIVKHFPNSFLQTTLLEHLQRESIERLVVCGMMTHMCVDATVRAAADYGYPLLVASDACATRTLSFDGTNIPANHVHRAFLAALRSYGQVLTADQILEQMKE